MSTAGLVPQLPDGYDPNQGIGRETVEQIRRDFARNGLELQLPVGDDPDFELLCDELAEVVDWLLANDQARFMQLLYRIDIGEQLVRRAMDDSGERTVPQKLGALIVRRETQKVLIRRHFSSAGSSSSE